MAGKKISELPQVSKIDGEEFVPVVANGVTKRVQTKLLKGADNLTNDYVELIGDDGESYRLTIKNGKYYVYPTIADTSESPREGENQQYWGLIINQIYGGGSALIDTSVSHSFIELYNTLSTPVNLRGLYLWYRPLAGSWKSLELKGIIPPYHSFLIRCGEHNDIHKDFVRCKITDYDMSWDVKLSNVGFSVYLCIGDTTPEDNPVKYTYDATGNVIATNGRYVDLIGAGGKLPSQSIWAYEGRYWNCLDEHTALHRIDYAYGNNNQTDCEPIDYKTCNVEVYKPRSLKDGEWDLYFNKIKLKPTCPNLINICYGEDGETTRTFTWQTSVTDEGYLKYRKLGDDTWIRVETSKRLVRHKDGDATIHSVIIKNLTEGVYEYQAGEEGMWSDLSTFEVKKYSSSDRCKFCLVTDQQGWTEEEYRAWKTSMWNISRYEDFDFLMNTGDISQNANRSFEWRYYFKHTDWVTREKCHMLTMGNNDLIDKKYSEAFTYYATFENQVWNSVHAWDLGYTHYVCLNSNTDYTHSPEFGGTDEFLQAQCDWLDTHLEEVYRRATPPRWVIVYMHLSPFTIVRTKRLQRFIPVFEKYKIPLVLCGHNHTYSRSKALYTGYDGTSPYNDYVTKVSGSTDLKIVDESNINKTENLKNGTHYIMCQATGYKLSGKEKTIKLPTNLQGTEHDNGNGNPWWYKYQINPTQPSYIMIDVGYNDIKLNMYYIQNIIETDALGNVTVHDTNPQTQTRYKFDTLTINYSDRV